jgi:hypothetical protein
VSRRRISLALTIQRSTLRYEALRVPRQHYRRPYFYHRSRDTVKPTRETETRLQADPLVQLQVSGQLTDAERDAGFEIRAICMG